MMQVANRACVRKIAMRSLRAFKTRNMVAVLAIVLTTMMFTALFAITISINDSLQQSNFLMSGGDDHGDFKNLTKEQMEQLQKDPLIKESDTRLFLGMGTGSAFRKTQVEISYMDAKAVKHYFCTPTHGQVPKEGTNQVMTDTRVLKLLGIKPKVGEQVTITYEIGQDSANKKEVTEQFVLSGWWDYNGVSTASHMVVPQSYAKKMLRGMKFLAGDETGTWTLGVCFRNSFHIEENMRQVIENQGFQWKDASKDHYIKFGVNWGYTNTQSDNHMDSTSVVAVGALLLLIVFTGYLVIYNVFQISVTNDIRFYGLLKTIGMTGKQTKRMIRQQALCLSCIGIPIGLVCGIGISQGLIPIVIRQLDCSTVVSRLHPAVLAGAALFSLITVLVSCNKPGKIAAKVSPVEATGYTENHSGCKVHAAKKKKSGTSLFSMAWANLGRNKKKTGLVVISLTLGVVLLNLVCTFANGFDMDLYLQKFCSSDFVFANADYFNVQKGFTSGDQAVEEDAIQTLLEQSGIKESGKIYGQTNVVQGKMSAEDTKRYFEAMGYGMTKEDLDAYLGNEEKAEDGKYYGDVLLYGMDELPIEKTTLIKGDLKALATQKDAIAAVYMQDDYNKAVAHTNWAKVGDKVTLRYVDSWKYYDKKSGKEIDADAIDSYDDAYVVKADKAKEKTYSVVAEIMVPSAEDYHYYGSPQFVLGSDNFIKDSGTDCVMSLIFDMKNNMYARNMEQFLKHYTEDENPVYNYESKFSYEQEFDSFRNMFLILGGVLSAVIAVVGILNFLNAILTGIIARRREFAVLQSIGMTRRQLQRMLMIEGLLYTFAAVVISILLVAVLEPMAGKVAGQMFWFFRFHYTIAPILIAAVFFVIIGATVPGIVYHFVGKHTIVERLRESD